MLFENQAQSPRRNAAMGGSGVIVLDKPDGTTSAQLVGHVKKLWGARKVGHAGTLDPMATGVLILCLNQATRLTQFFLHSPKTYQAELELGVETDTQDRTGRLTAAHQVPHFSERKLQAVFKRFEGPIAQRPPVYSALKYQGKPLYRWARSGQPVQKPARKVLIEFIRIVKIDLPSIGFEVRCTGGTYIRTLCADIGQALGCGAHLKKLRRTESAGFSLAEAITVGALNYIIAQGRQQQQLIPMAEALRTLPKVAVNHALKGKILHGQPLGRDDLPRPLPLPNGRGHIGIVDEGYNLVAVLKVQELDPTIRYCCVFNAH